MPDDIESRDEETGDLEMSTEPEEGDEEAGSVISEEYIDSVKAGIGEIIPEDFERIEAEIPVEGKDGTRVSILVTGTVSGGKLTNSYGSEVKLNGNEPNKKLKKIFAAENADET
jgi:hypothetical protein